MSNSFTDAPEVTEPPLGGHIPALDAVRGLAILLVLLFHFSSYGHGLPPASMLADRVFHVLTRACWVGVDLFFVLSGFLITGILHDSKSGARYFRNFYARRALRIFPLYYGTLLAFFVVLPRMFPDSERIGAFQSNAFWHWTYLSNIRVAQAGWPPFDALGHFWSLAVEEQFYLVWPAVVLLFGRCRLIQICLWCVCGALVIRSGLVLVGSQPAAYVLTPARMDALAVGSVLALAARGPAGLAGLARWASPAAALSGSLLIALFIWRRGLAAHDPLVATIGHTLLACFFGAVLVLALTSPPHRLIGKVFSSGLLCFFGRYSYALYVFHHPILFLNAGLWPLGLVPTLFGSLLLKKLTYIVSATVVSVVLAFTSWHLYEKHFLQLKRLFPYASGDETNAFVQSRSPASLVICKPDQEPAKPHPPS
jgi:peptidoglycan/LPS O-acetylase OafA/YrhL